MHRLDLALLLLLLPFVSAHRYSHRHRHGSGSPSGYGSGSAPSASAVEGPYGAGNATVLPASTGLGTAVYSSATVVADPAGSSDGTTTITVQPIQSSSPRAAAAESSDASPESGFCGSTITVIETSQVTVTLTFPAAAASSAALPPPPGASPGAAQVSPVQFSAPPPYPSPASGPAPVWPVQSSAPPLYPSLASGLAPVWPVQSSAPPPYPSPASGPAPVWPVQSSVPPPYPSPASGPAPVWPVQSSAPPPYPSPASSAAPVQSSAAPPASPMGVGKRGLLMHNDTGYSAGINNLVAALNQGNTKIAWVCTWNQEALNDLTSSVEWFPTLWNLPTDGGADWKTAVKPLVKSGTKALINLGEQERANPPVSAAQAASSFMQDMQPWVSQGVTVGTPSTLDESDMDWQWLSDFVAACTGCTLDFIAFHFMVGPTTTWTPQEMFVMLQEKVSQAYTIGGGKIPVWIDNMAVPGTAAFQQSWLELVIPWLEANETVGRYAYVPQDPSGSSGDGFFDTSGTLNSLATWYLSYDA